MSPGLTTRWPDPVSRLTHPGEGWPVSVGSLQRAWRAVQAGAFDTRTHPALPTAASVPAWSPQAGERAIAVVGVSGGVGATTTALALATAAAPARLVEFALPESSGLGAACDAELGEADGWLLGRRAEVMVQRRAARVAVPVPAPPGNSNLTVVDLGSWDATIAVWLADANQAAGVVLVVPASLPGLRRVELVLADLPPVRVCVAGLGRPVRRWPRTLAAALAAATRHLIDQNRWITVPANPELALTGITPDALPRDVLAAGQELLTALEGL